MQEIAQREKSQSFLLCPTGSFEIRSHLQAVLPLVKPAEMLWHCGKDPSFTAPESPVDAPGGLHTQLTTSRQAGEDYSEWKPGGIFTHSSLPIILPSPQGTALPSFHDLLKAGV